MEKMLVTLMREPTPDSAEGDVTAFRFAFRKTPKSKIGTPEEPRSTAMFTVRLKVSNSLLTTHLWPLTDHVGRIKCFYQFIRGELQRTGLSTSPVREMELNREVKDADRLPEIHKPDQVQMYEGFYCEAAVVNSKHLIGYQHRLRST